MEEITVHVRDSFAVPQLCCACGGPAGNKTLSASRSVTRGRRWESIALRFPLCDACERATAAASRTVHRRQAIGFLAGVGLAAPLCLLATAAFEVSPILGAATLALLALLGGLVGRWLAWQWPRHLRDTYIRRCRAVRVTRYQPGLFGRGRATLAFTNSAFASAFRQMNRDAVATRPAASELLARLLLLLMLLALLAGGSYLLYHGLLSGELTIAATVWEQPVLLALGSAMAVPAALALLAFLVKALLRLGTRG
jgi:hypothetical protein